MEKSIHIPLLFMLAFLSAYDMQNNSKMQKTLMKEGRENPVVRFGTLEIEPVNLFIPPEPRNDRSPQVELELKATQGDETYSTFICFYACNDDRNENRYPLAFRDYLLSLEVNDKENGTEVNLVVGKNDFGKAFFIEAGREAIVGGLTVRFDDAVHEHAQFEPDGPCIGGAVYYFTLSDGGEQKQINFTSYEMHSEGSLLFEWKQYKIQVWGNNGAWLKLKIDRQ